MKKIITLLALLTAFTAKSQDTTKQYNLTDVQVVGIRTDKREPTTVTKINCDSVSPFVSLQKDPFFVIEKMTPSIYAQSDNGQANGYSYMRMRGLDQTRINFNLNGVPLNEMEDQGIYFSNMPGFYNYIGNISVQRGVGTSKYGNTSIAGSVNMETIDMSRKFTDINTFLVGNNKNSFSNIFYSSGLNKNGFAVQLGGTYVNNVGFREHSGNDGGSIFYSIGSFKNKNIIRLYGFIGKTHNQLAYYGVSMDSINNNYHYNANSIDDRDTFKQNFSCLNWIRVKSPTTKFNSSFYFNSVSGTYNSGGVLYGVNSGQFGAMTNMVYEKKHKYLNIGLNTNIYTREHFGSDSMGYYLLDFNNFDSLKRYENRGNKKDVIAYLKGLDINGNFNVFYDIQVRSVWLDMPYFSKNWTFLNPKFGFKRISKNNDIYMNFGVTKREPTRSDIIQNVVMRKGYVFANTDNTNNLKNSDIISLSPETLVNVEMGINYHISDLDVNTNLYFMGIQNEFIATGNMDIASGLMEKKQVTSTYRSGIEMNLKLKVNKFNIFTNMQFQNNSYTDIDTKYKIPFTPNFIGSMGISYKYKSFLIGSSTQSVSSMYIDASNKNSSSAYTVVNGFIDWKWNNLTTSLKVGNILNSKYYIPAMMIGTTPTYYVGQLKNWSLTLNYRF